MSSQGRCTKDHLQDNITLLSRLDEHMIPRRFRLLDQCKDQPVTCCPLHIKSLYWNPLRHRTPHQLIRVVVTTEF